MLNKYFNKKTPIILPKTPPNSSIKPIKKSTLALLICAKKPETDAAKIWFASDATATAGGIHIKINMGVIKNLHLLRTYQTKNRPLNLNTLIQKN